MAFSLNKIAREKQKKIIFYVLAGFGVIAFAGYLFMSGAKGNENKTKETPNLTGVTTSEFTGSETKSAIEKEQSQVDEVRKQMDGMKSQMESLQKTLTTNSNAQVINDLQSKVVELETQLKNQNATNSGRSQGYPGSEGRDVPQGISTVSFSYDGSSGTKAKDPISYVPAGTFTKAVLLSGADTNAGTGGQTDTLPITMRILDNGTLPNKEHSSLKGCFVTAAAYGDASSERGQIRLQRLSCVRSGGHILDIPVEGTVSDMGGNDGIRGHIVTRNGKILFNAGASGALSGIGSAMQQSLTTQSISPLGATQTVPPGKVFQYGAYGGANTAFSKLADYYIKLAELYHPIVQIHAGSNVDITFLKGFWLDDNDLQTEPVATPKVSNDTQNLTIPPTQENLQKLSSIGKYTPDAGEQKRVLPDLKNTQLGQTVNPEGDAT